MSTKNIKEKIDVPKAKEEDPVEIQNELLSKMLDQLRTLVYVTKSIRCSKRNFASFRYFI
jgi:hypothetical protein